MGVSESLGLAVKEDGRKEREGGSTAAGNTAASSTGFHGCGEGDCQRKGMGDRQARIGKGHSQVVLFMTGTPAKAADKVPDLVQRVQEFLK